MGHVATWGWRGCLLLGLLICSQWCLTPSSAQTLNYSCDEFGLEAALLTGGGPHTFNCTQPTVIPLTAPHVVTTSVILDGGGNLTLSGGGISQIFQVSAGATLELRNLTLSDGSAYHGGAVYVEQGALLLDHVRITENRAASSGGAIYNSAQGTVTITDSILQENQPSSSVIYNASRTPSSLTIQESCILDQGLVSSGSPIIATQNWWGSVDGPAEDARVNVDAGGFLTRPGDPAPQCQSLIAGLIWRDLDNDQQPDENETGTAGVHVDLIDSATQQIIATTETSASGRYQFINPPETEVILAFPQLNALHFNPGSELVDPATGHTPPFSVTSTAILADLDIGLLKPPAGLMLLSDEAGLTVEEGRSQSYEVMLLSEPDAPVIVTIQAGDRLLVNGTAVAELTFTDTAGAAPWNHPQTITLTVPENAVFENQQTITIAYSARSADPRYQIELSSDPTTTLTITDNDTARVELAPAALAIVEGGSGDYVIRLASQPLAPVTISAASSNPRCEVTASGILDVQNWNIGIVMTGRVIDDQQVIPGETCLISHTLSSDDAVYAAMPLEPVTITLTENDTAGVLLDAAESLILNEGDSLSYSAALTSQPAVPVVLAVNSSSALCEVMVSEPFTAENWNTGITITVQSQENHVVQGNEACVLSHVTSGDDLHYQFSADVLPRLTIQLSDNDRAGVSVSLSTLTLAEGESTSFTVTLTSEPTAPTTLQPLESDPGCSILSAEALDSSNWNTGVVVSIGSADNNNVDGNRLCVIRYTLNTTDPVYNLPLDALPPVEITVQDDDAAGIALSQTELTLQEGQSAAYSLRLTSQPTAPLTVEPYPSVSGCTVTAAEPLTAENWQTGIAITVAASETAVAEGARTCTIRHVLTGEDTLYAGEALSVPEMIVSMTDNDSAGVSIGGNVVQMTEGETAAYLITLTSQPTAPVTVRVLSSNPACEIVVSGVLDANNWNSGMTVIVTSAEDAIHENTEICQLQHSLESGDADYHYPAESLPQVEVTIIDNDTAGAVIGAEPLQLREGETATYPITLTSQPLAPVVVEVLSSLARCPVIISGDLTAENWQSGIMVQITLPEDEIRQEQAECQLSHRLSSADPAYNIGADALALVQVTALDNDRAGVTLSQSEFTLTEGGQASYTLHLTSEPAAPVTVETQATPECSIAASENVLDAGNWQAGLTLTISIHDDMIVEAAAACTIQHNLSSADPNYALSTGDTPAMTVTILDNDRASAALSPETLQIAEGESASYQLMLTSQPLSEVQLSVSTTSTDCTAEAGESLTPENWQTGVSISVSVQDDLVAETDRACAVLHTLSSADPYYNLQGEALPAMPIAIVENDRAGAGLSAEIFTLTEGQIATYTLEIISQPAAPVTLEAVSNSTECIVRVAGTLDATTWRDGLEINVITTDNFVIESSRTCEISHRLLSEDAFYTPEAILLPNVVIMLMDDDAAAAVISENTLNLLEGESVSYTLALTSQPEQAVLVEVISSDGLCEIENPIPAITADNWQTGSTITVRSQDDQIAGSRRTCQLTHRLTSLDPNYDLHADALPSATVNVEEDDRAGVMIGVESVTQTEGLTNSYSVSLNSQPTAPVTLSVTASNPACQVSVSGNLTPENWQAGVTVTIQTPEDFIVQEAQTCILAHTLSGSDSAYQLGTGALPDVTVTIADNDQAGIHSSESSLSTPEGGSASYTLALATQPLQPVVITAASSNPVCAVSNPVVLDANNWANGAVVTISAADDTLSRNNTSCQITHTLSTADPFYAVLAIPDIAMAVADNDQPGIKIGQLTFDAVEGEVISYPISLNSQPSAPVFINSSSNVAGCLTGQEGMLDSENWQTGILLAVTIVDDGIAQGQHSCLITHTIRTEDADYVAAGISPVNIVIADNEVIDLSFSQRELTVREGNTATYSVTLSVEPASRYDLQAESSDALCAILLSAETLDAANWNTGITVTVTVPDNASQDAARSCSLTHRLLTVDGDLISLSDTTITVQVLDDDLPGVDIEPAALAVTEGGSGVYAIRLTTMPAEPVMITVEPENAECSVTVFGSLAAENWQTGIAVTVVVVEDAIAQGERTCLLTHSLSSADPGYAPLAATIPPLMVTITDNDVPGVSLSTETLSITEGDSGNYTLFLKTQPITPVTVEVSSDQPACRVAQPENILDESNWSTGITIAVTAADDSELMRGTSCTLTHHLTSADSAYHQENLPPVVVSILDNDQANLSLSTDSLTLPEGEVASYSLSLSHAPDAPVEVLVTASDADCIVSAGGAFTPENWQTGVTVTVQAAEDQVVMPGRACTLLHQLSSTDAAFNITTGLPAMNVSVADNDTASLQIEPAAVLIPEGDSASYTLRLTSQPQADVTVFADADIPECGVNISEALTGENWQTGIAVVVTTLENDTVGEGHTCTIRHRLSSADPAYNLSSDGLPLLTATVTDDDLAGIIVEPLRLTLVEGEQAVVNLRLTSSPQQPVQLDLISNSVVCAVTSPVRLDHANWQAGIPVSINTLDNEVYNEAQFCSLAVSASSSDPAYNPGAVAAIQITVTNDEPDTLLIQPQSLAVTEGGTGEYRLALTSAPQSPVTVQILPSDAFCTVHGNTVLDDTNWQSGINVQVGVSEDSLATPGYRCTIQHRLISQEPRYTLEPEVLPTITLNASDNDTASVMIGTTSAAQSEGRSNSYSVSLTSQPVAPVQLRAQSSDPLCTVVVSGELDASNWNTGVTVTVSSSDDAGINTPRTCLIRHSTSSADPAYSIDAGRLPTVTITVTDNDVAGLQLYPAEVHVTEGEQAAYIVMLTSQPSAPVLVEAISESPLCSAGSAVTLDAANWNSGAAITISAQEDFVIASGQSCTLRHQLTSNDPAYNFTVETMPAAQVLLDDNDTAAVQVNTAPLTLTEGTSASYSLTLTSQPAAPVEIIPTMSNPACVATVSGALGSSNWNTGVLITVQAVDDQRVGQGNQCVIGHLLRTEDPAYLLADGTVPSVTADILENDTAGVLIEPQSVELEEGGSADYRVALTSEPNAPVLLNAVSSEPLCEVSTNLILDASNWNTGISITVTAPDNSVMDEARHCLMSHQFSSEDTSYNLSAETLPVVEVAVLDNDVAGVVIDPLELTVREGQSVSYTVRLATPPAAAATLNLIPSSAECGITTSGVLDASNWNTGIMVTISINDTGAVDGNRTCTITNHSLGSSDPMYTIPPGVMPAVQVTILDNDSPQPPEINPGWLEILLQQIREIIFGR